MISAVSCGPGDPEGIIQEYAGSFIAGTPESFLHFGCRIHTAPSAARLDELRPGGTSKPAAQLWHFDGRRRIWHEAVLLTEFELENHYSENYGSNRPVWRYVYRNDHGITVRFNEYADGSIQPELVFTSHDSWIDDTMIDALPESAPLTPEPPGFEAQDLVTQIGQLDLLDELTRAYAKPDGPERVMRQFGTGYVRTTGAIDYVRDFARTVGLHHVERGRTVDFLPESNDDSDSIQIQLFDTVTTETERDTYFASVAVADPSKRYDRHGSDMTFTAKLSDVRRRNLADGTRFLLRMAIVHPPGGRK